MGMGSFRGLAKEKASRTAWSERGVSKVKEEGAKSITAMRTEAMRRAEMRNTMGLQLQYRTAKPAGEFQMRREMLGKSSQTLMPQKWEPSVQMGVVMLARMWQGGPM